MKFALKNMYVYDTNSFPARSIFYIKTLQTLQLTSINYDQLGKLHICNLNNHCCSNINYLF